MGNVKIYDELNFDMQIEIKSEINEPIEFGDYRGKEIHLSWMNMIELFLQIKVILYMLLK